MKFKIRREERVSYWYEFDRAQVIDMLVFHEHGTEGQYAAMTDEQLLGAFQDALNDFDGVHAEVVERTEKYGDVEYNDITASLAEG